MYNQASIGSTAGSRAQRRGLPTCPLLVYNIQVIPELLLNKSAKTFVQLFRSLCASGFVAGSSLNYMLCSRWLFPRTSVRSQESGPGA